MRPESFLARRRRLATAVAAIVAVPCLAGPAPVAAEGLFDFFFGSGQPRPQREVPQANAYADPFTGQQSSAPQYVPPTRLAAGGGSGPAFCVRSCDGKYFPLMRGVASPAQMCQAFCPASATKIYFGTSDGLVAYTGIRVGNDQSAEFTPAASYPGLTAQVRARLGEMKVAPVRAETVAADAPAAVEIVRAAQPEVRVVPKTP